VIDAALDDALDRWSAALFGGELGGARLQPLLALWEREIGAVRGEDPELEVLHAVRVDWALCEALGPGETRPWCVRDDAEGVLEPVLRDAVRRSWVGLFEVWPHRGGAGAWLRDRLGGACATLQGPVDVAIAAEGPSALWELRVVIKDGALHACRRPIAYPLALVDLLGEGDAPQPGRPARLLQVLRRTRLWQLRAPRVDPRSVFAEALRTAIL
jgi:hypothetical protein